MYSKSYVEYQRWAINLERTTWVGHVNAENGLTRSGNHELQGV